VSGWIPEGQKELGDILNHLATSIGFGFIEHVGWSDDIKKGDLAYDGCFSNSKDAEQFCQLANAKITDFLKTSM